jgi:phosphoesterase RecJ-like protein
MIRPDEYEAAQRWLTTCRRPLVVTHRRPDGDALGAVAGLTVALHALGIDATAALFEPFPQRYALLHDLVSWHDWPTERAALTRDCDALIVLDTCSVQQLEPVADWLPQAPRMLVIDHHPTRDALGTRPGDLRLLDESAGAVCLLVAELLKTAGMAWTPALATALLVGLGTDTGWFRFPNTDARLLHAAAELTEAGAAVNLVFRAIYEQDAPARLRLTGRMLQTLELHADGQLAVLKLRRADFAAAGADRTMTEDLVNEAGRLAGIEATILFTEEADQVRVNFRSKERLDVAKLAAQFGGGGHTRAAGARLAAPWDQAVTAVLAAALAALSPRGVSGAIC